VVWGVVWGYGLGVWFGGMVWGYGLGVRFRGVGIEPVLGTP